MKTWRPTGHGFLFALMPLIVAACGSGASSSLPPAPRTADEACLAAAGAGSWQVAVEIGRANTSVLAMERDADIASCQTAKSADLGGYDNTTVGVGTHPVTSPQPLTYATSHVLRDGTPSVLIGRVPFDTATVRLILGDASTESASLGHGLWLAWLATPATPVTI